MIETLIPIVGPWVIGIVGAALGGSVLNWVLGKIPTEKIKIVFGKIMYGLGVTVTLGLAKWKYSAKVWNKTIEPWVIVFLESLISYGLSEFVRGLRSDNSK